MALEAESAEVLEIAFAAAFHHGDDMVGVPEAFPRPGAQAPAEQSFQAGSAAQSFELALGVQAIDAATGANTVVPFEHFFAKIAGIAA